MVLYEGVHNKVNEQKAVPHVEYHLLKYVKEHHLILDVGCGTAPYRHSTPGTYVGLDASDEPYGINPRSVDIVASAAAIPEPDSKYDLIFSVSAFYQFPDPERVLNEFYRILKPSGRLILFDYNRRTQKRLEISEGRKRPCWTQWRLMKLVSRAGFRDCVLLLPLCREVTPVTRWLRLLHQELFGTWAIVSGVKPV